MIQHEDPHVSHFVHIVYIPTLTPPCDARDDTLPTCASTFFFSRAELNFLSRTDSGLPAAETPSSASTPAPGSAARKVRSVVRREDILEELHVAVRLRGEPLFRRQKLQSSMD